QVTTDRGTILEARSLPGPTGESNRWTTHPRGTILCLGPDAADAARQAEQASTKGCAAVSIAPGAAIDGTLDPDTLRGLTGFTAVAYRAGGSHARALRKALTARAGPILPLLTGANIAAACVLERHVCTDTTAAGGNATLIAASGL
ncbi:bifunctional proline dehydrogenase/L-glutamate gamma-semialdehyde dehydrogenase, partial [Rhizobiaceae bacterium]|nr:bifunctional proline dehydrogenase/L-glutamate gamma-semialdehyde dehydrogenase [Rhizobiaceae bacterium]